MWTLGALAFANPWLLSALIVLPGLYWLLRLLPPSPRRVRFPAMSFLLGLPRTEETAAHTPWWLVLLRMSILLLLIFALSGPYWNPTAARPGSGPLLIVVDNGWTAAQQWQKRIAAVGALIEGAARANRPVALATTAPEIMPPPLAPRHGEDARMVARALSPAPLPVDRAQTIERLHSIDWPAGTEIVWISDGLQGRENFNFAEKLLALGSLTIVHDREEDTPLALLPPEPAGTRLKLNIIRAHTRLPRSGAVRLVGEGNRQLAREIFQFQAGDRQTHVLIDLPQEMRNEAVSAELVGIASAGTKILFDERWRKRRVGLLSGETLEKAQPLLSDLYYVERALSPFAEMAKLRATADLPGFLENGASVLVLTDIGKLVGIDHDILLKWIDSGGVLIRFAGPKLASAPDELIPIPLRDRGRAFGGSLTWEQPQGLAPFDPDSPFFGLDVPTDVKIRRQVLAEPSPELDAHSWARLSDGTPLVTATARGRGHIVLFHVTAGADWSNLPLSGLYVGMLRKLVGLSRSGWRTGNSQSSDAGHVLIPLETMNGLGVLGPPNPVAQPLKAGEFDKALPDARHPPGFYGPASAPRALNVTYPQLILKPLTEIPARAQTHYFESQEETAMAPALVLAAFLLALADSILALRLDGVLDKMRHLRRRAVTAGFLILIFLGWTFSAANAQESNKGAETPLSAAMLEAALETRLAYVVTGDRDTDALSRAGLEGLGSALRNRTALEPGPPMGIDIERDEIAFFPFIYWPVLPTAPELSPQTIAKLDIYLKRGGMILFDTRDAEEQANALPNLASRGKSALMRVLGNIDLPRLEPVPDDHVLTKSFYLLREFPGRYADGELWVQADDNAGSDTGFHNDGVSPVIIGSNDYAAAWARDASGRPLASVIPGGERQRELAMRVGINFIMYTLTGNYKADQVHAPALLERLGQ
jgi:hypothetical protein